MAINGTDKENTVAVVGGGIGGLGLAIGLLNKKVPLHIYEGTVQAFNTPSTYLLSHNILHHDERKIIHHLTTK